MTCSIAHTISHNKKTLNKNKKTLTIHSDVRNDDVAVLDFDFKKYRLTLKPHASKFVTFVLLHIVLNENRMHKHLMQRQHSVTLLNVHRLV